MEINKILQGDCLAVLKTLPDESIDCVMTSPPYWGLRDYGVPGQLGLELRFEDYISNLCNIFDEIRRVLKKEGSCWVNVGDSYAGSGKGPEGGANKGRNHRHLEHKTKPFVSKECQAKSLVQIPSRFAIEMTNRGWILRNEIIWHKPNCMPASVKDRFTVDFEKLFFFVKSKKYYFETQFEPYKCNEFYPSGTFGKKSLAAQAGVKIKLDKQGRNKRAVWIITTRPFKEAHFATYPEALCETPIKAGCPEGGIVLDPFFGAGTTAVVARKLKRNFIGIELNSEYIKIAEKRLRSMPVALL